MKPIKKSLIPLAVAILMVLAMLVASRAGAQCDPEKMFVPSVSFELTSDWGLIGQAGLAGQISPLSLHAGVRIREFVSEDTLKLRRANAKMMVRGEVSYRIVNGVHVNVGVASQIDVGVTAYKRIGEQFAFYGRALYDGALMFGLGMNFIFYRQ